MSQSLKESNKIFPTIDGNISTDTIRNIKQLKTNRKAFIDGPPPKRVMKILEHSKPIFEEYRSREKDNLKKYRQSKLNMMPDLTSIIGDKKVQEESEKEATGPKFNTQRLNTPTLKRMALVNDGRQALKDEINESYLRVKAAKHGMKLEDLVPNHGIEFYMPQKIDYIKPKERHKVLLTKSTLTSKNTLTRGKETNTFITSLNHSQVVTKSKQHAMSPIERSVQHKLNQSSVVTGHHPGRQKNKSMNYTAAHVPATTKFSDHKQRSNILKGAGNILTKGNHSVVNSPTSQKFGTSPGMPRRLNAVSYNFNKDQNINHQDQRRKIRMVSLIDSKPINHYITLLNLKEFSKREQDMSGIAGGMQASSGIKEKEYQKNRDVAKILREDLNEHYEEKIGKQYAAFMENKNKNKISSNKLSLSPSPVNEDKNNDSLLVGASADNQNKNRRSSRKTRVYEPDNADLKISNIKNKENNLNEKLKNIINPDLLKSLEDNFKQMILDLYNFHHRQEEEQRENDHQSENKIESEEQAKRIAQLKRDQQLADFEEKGGLTRILTNLFSSKDESIELDSVYQLKQL